MKFSGLKKILYILLIINFGFLFSEELMIELKEATNMKNDIIFGTWMRYSKKSENDWLIFFNKYKEAGITDYFIQANPNQLRKLINLTKPLEINIHAWVWTLNRPNDKEAMKNKDWYSVNKLGQNSYDFRPYVDYYQWLSPFSEGARNHIKKLIDELSKIENLASVHLDYVRYSDIFLPIKLQPKYGLDQSYEMPEYDFGYHPIAREMFKKQYGLDPKEIKNDDLKDEWLKFRLDAVTNLVNELTKISHTNGTKISAAVFPYPEMARRMVRQDWASWNVDLVCPMNYHHFYNEDIDWINFSVDNGVNEISGKFNYYSGVFVGALNHQKFREAIIGSINAGANGVVFFSVNNLSKEHLDVLHDITKNPQYD